MTPDMADTPSNNDRELEQCVRFFTLPRRHMTFFKFIMEAYEGLATLSTADKLNGIVRLSWDCRSTSDLEQLLSALQQEIQLVEVSVP
jgi:hypothetical protein